MIGTTLGFRDAAELILRRDTIGAALGFLETVDDVDDFRDLGEFVPWRGWLLLVEDRDDWRDGDRDEPDEDELLEECEEADDLRERFGCPATSSPPTVLFIVF